LQAGAVELSRAHMHRGVHQMKYFRLNSGGIQSCSMRPAVQLRESPPGGRRKAIGAPR